ncbi:hypothetical protein [Vagococcus coleopterorum]|nr:hypothetical protein [Vagococcus coleopterorum]
MARKLVDTSDSGSSLQRSGMVGFFEDDVPRCCQLAQLVYNTIQ